MYVGVTLLDIQALRKAAENLKSSDFISLSIFFDNRGVPIWPLAALSLAFRYCEIFLGALYNTSAIIGLS